MRCTYYSPRLVAHADDLQDERQMLGGSGHIVFNDPCRTWHFSLTIEGNMARLWIHTRSHSAVTYAFDIQSVCMAAWMSA